MENMFHLLVGALLVLGAYGSALAEPERNLDDQNRIMNGWPAAEGEFPSQLSFRNYETPLCGASILNEEWALTTANCVDGINIDGISLLSGTIDWHTRNGTEHNATEIVIHPDYVSFNIKINDIALIRVEQPFELDGVLRKPIILPERDSVPAESATGTIVGLGKHQQGGPPSDFLYKTDVKVSNFDACSASMHIAMGYYLVPTQICSDVPADGLGSCFGDEGGPMFVDGVTVGLISWGEGCAPLAYEFSVYTRVSAYVDWINSVIGSRDDMDS